MVKFFWSFITIFLILKFTISAHNGEEHTKYYSNEWVIRLEGGQDVAELISAKLGYKLLGKVTGFNDTYRIIKEDIFIQKKRNHALLTETLEKDSRVIWAEQQFTKERVKRGFLYDNSLSTVYNENNEKLTRQSILNLLKEKNISYNQEKILFRPSDVSMRYASYDRFNDELWNQQWYLQDTRTQSNLPKLDLHVLPVYDLGITGKGVRVLILDDGIEYTHEDLWENYDPEISYDANDEDDDPFPRLDEEGSNAHGTRCAGEVAMKANNLKCGVGVAFNARVGALRLLDGEVNDRIEGIALGYAYDKVDIYSASWGPTDDGKTVEGPGRLAKEAIERGVTEGRNGKGVIYVWAGGNGGSKDDNCDCDGYIGSIYTLSIGSASQHGQFPWYGEKCAATMAATYSSGAYADQMIATTDVGNTCTIKHTGTSASAPLAAGIIALALEANSDLTWRDIQHLVAWTSEYSPLSENEGWVMNAAGFWVNTRFGFGLMNAYSLVAAAINWTNVPEKYSCSIEAGKKSEEIYWGKDVNLEINATVCDYVYYLEHVELEINIEYPVRGNLEIFLESPSGTNIQLLGRRKNDSSKRGFKNWKLMSVLTWNENPRGIWKVTVTDKIGTAKQKGRTGKFILHLHGLYDRPKYLENQNLNTDNNKMNKKNELNTIDIDDKYFGCKFLQKWMP
ncbi:Furin-1 precursor, putative [Pediculus humanus corporis]|uniref:furin n=1 Tax=Pediculus humanus subsp. corporis TaxID=121224 RepID=E0VJJ3_PEDHC|nr:Furin-1 precursor, putative [Pediculus humanus corporis]EEB13549.1 Furin-1 precursor, putative [Pediculus humanus corporis]